MKRGRMRSTIIALFLVLSLQYVVHTPLVLAAPAEEEVFSWNDPDDLEKLTNQEILGSLDESPDLLDRHAVYSEFESRLDDREFVSKVNANLDLLNKWADKKGITFTEGSGLKLYEDNLITTQGIGTTTFHPSDFSGSIVLSDGSLLLPSSKIVNGELSGQAELFTLQYGTLISEGNIMLVKGESQLTAVEDKTVVEGTATINGRKLSSSSEFSVSFVQRQGSTSAEGKDVNTVLTTLDQGEVTIYTAYEEEETVIGTLHKGEAEILDDNRILLGRDHMDRMYRGQGSSADIKETRFSYSDLTTEDASFSVGQRTLFCHNSWNCNIKLSESSRTKDTTPPLSKIEVYSSMLVKKSTGTGETEQDLIGRDLLKITAVDGNTIDVDLVNPAFDTIYVDSRQNNKVTITQRFGYEKERHELPFSSMIITDGQPDLRGFEDAPLQSNPVLIPNNDAVFSEEILDESDFGSLITGAHGDLIEGIVWQIIPQDPNYLEPGEFNIHDYTGMSEILAFAMFNRDNCGENCEEDDLKGVSEIGGYYVDPGLLRYLDKEEAEFRKKVQELINQGKYNKAARLYEERGDYRKAVELFVKSGDADYASVIAKSNSELFSKEEIEEVNRLGDIHEKRKTKAMKDAREAYKEGRVEEAIDLIKDVQDWKAVEWLDELGEGDRAIEISIESEDWYGAAELAKKYGKSSSEIENYFERRLDWLRESDPDLWRLYGARDAKKLGLEKTANQLLKEAIVQYLNDGEPINAANAAEEMGDIERAIEIYLNSNNYLRAAEEYHHLGQTDKAIEYYLKAGSAATALATADSPEKIREIFYDNIDLMLNEGNYLSVFSVLRKNGLQKEADLITEKFEKGEISNK